MKSTDWHKKRLPYDVVRKNPPTMDEPERRKPVPIRYGKNWKWIARAVGAQAPYWHLIHRDAPNRQAAYNINSGANPHIDKHRYKAQAVKVQKDPELFDIYLTVRRPEGDEMVTSSEEQREFIAEARRDWRENGEREWLTEVTQRVERITGKPINYRDPDWDKIPGVSGEF